LFDSSNTIRQVDVANQIFYGEYYNIVYRYNGTTFTLWRNNSLVGTLTQTVTLPTPGGASLTSATEWFNGSMHVVQYYNRGLTDAEIGQNYNAFRRRFGL
jgi:hypothetical protein